MIQRVVTVKLNDEFATDAIRARIAEETPDVLRQAHGVLDVRVGVPSDSRTRREWDLCILVRFASQEDVDQYRDDPVHRAYADDFLAPMQKSIRVWNFEVAE